MYCLFFLFASFFLCEVSAGVEPIQKIIQDYFNSESVRRFRKSWEIRRKPIEHAILTALKETVSSPGMNVYVNKQKEKLAAGYLHSDNQVRLILSELNLEDTPHCLLPEVQLSLASNVLKIQTTLSKMIIHADYSLLRNKSDIIYEPNHQDSLKSSPFLFEQVQDVGKVAITMEGCTISGFIMTILNGESVNLGYDHFKFYNCQYFVEIYRPGENSPPVIAPYAFYREHGLDLTHLLMKPLLTEELVPKLQAAIFSFVNTTALFGNALLEYRANQEIVFQTAAQHFTKIIRDLNKVTVEKNQGAIEMADFHVHWDDGRMISKRKQNTAGETITLMDMVLTGLDTMYSAHCGGPFKIETILMADEIRFSSLQVRGKLVVNSIWSDTFPFAVEISDMVVDLQMGKSHGDQEHTKDAYNGFKRFEVTGLRRMIFTVPKLIFASAESMVSGYVLNEVPKLLRSHLSAIFSEAIRKDPPFPSVNLDEHEDKNTKDDDHSAETDSKSEPMSLSDSNSLTDSNPLTDSEDREYQELKGKRARAISKKPKKLFKSATRSRLRHRLRRYGSRKHVVDNEIRKK